MPPLALQRLLAGGARQIRGLLALRVALARLRGFAAFSWLLDMAAGAGLARGFESGLPFSFVIVEFLCGDGY
ncbi:hypothetical protein [Cupriavidus sp. CuC1]|uniref:hypothetical protein n=1 Tax=Cupriavidus sp. CuC1 TaxID=3373131 RepID=UPI0037D267C0